MKEAESDPRLRAYLEVAAERGHPFYARQAWRFAREAGDEAAMQLSIRLGALDWRPEPPIRMRGDGRRKMKPVRGEIIQLQLFEEAA